MASNNTADRERELPVCGLLHRIKTAGTGPGHPFRYRCCDSRDCRWKKHTDDIAYCLFDQAHS